MADALDVGATAVSNAVVRGWFPASWYVTCSALAVLSGIECPPKLFGMRKPNATPIVDGWEDIQEPASGMESLTHDVGGGE